MNRIFKNFIKNITSGKSKFVLVGLIIAAFAMYLLVGPLNMLSVGGSYSNAYEGAKPSFAGIEYNGVKITENRNGVNGYYSNEGMSFSAKADGPSYRYRGLPKIVGEMTPVFIPQNTNPGDLPAQFDVGGVKFTNPFTGSFSAYNNPYDTHSWPITSGQYKTYYTMEEWKTKFYVSISANPDGESVPFVSSEWDEANGRYSDFKVWIRLDTSPTWYFQGQEKAYFAIAQVQLSGISYGGHSPDGSVQASHNQQKIIVNPSSPSSGATLFLNNFGVGGNKAADPQQIYSYKGVQLNPQYFGNAVYFCINLNSFGSQSWWDGVLWKSQGDVVSFDFTVTQFVVGQWTVKNTQSVPVGYGRQSSYSEYGLDFSAVTDFFNSPMGWLILLTIAGIVLIVIVGIVIFKFPEVVGLVNKGAKSASSRIPKPKRQRQSKGKTKT